jgi:hypothetical protein
MYSKMQGIPVAPKQLPWLGDSSQALGQTADVVLLISKTFLSSNHHI